MATAGGRVVPGFGGCWDEAIWQQRGGEATQSEQHGHEQHRAQSTERRAKTKKRDADMDAERRAERGAARVGIYK